MFEVGTSWEHEHPNAHVGVLVMGAVENPKRHRGLDREKQRLEQALRERYASADRDSLRAKSTLAAYDAYYREYRKTYHVQHQLESVVFKGKPIPKVAALVEAMFMAELKNLLLTAGHDKDAVELPLRIEAASGDETYERMNGEGQSLKAGDMMITDGAGVISCILYGPDRRTRIIPETKSVVFTVYAPPGIDGEEVQRHLADIRNYVRVIAPSASVELQDVFGAAE